MEGELGLDIKPEGIIKIEELLQGEKVVMYHLLAKSEEEFNPNGEAKTTNGCRKEEIENMQTEEFTEFLTKTYFFLF